MGTLATITAGAGADTAINQNNVAIAPASTYGYRAPATSGLTWAYYGGKGFGNTISDGTVSLTASTTNYVVASKTTGAVSVSTGTTNWNNGTDYQRLYAIVTGSSSITSFDDFREFLGGGGGGGGGTADTTHAIIIACGDETTVATTGAAKVTFRMPYAFTLSAVRSSLTAAPTGSAFIIDINENGSSILSTKLSIDASEKTSTTAASAAVISDPNLADDAEITIDFDQIGSGTAGAGAKVYLIGTKV